MIAIFVSAGCSRKQDSLASAEQKEHEGHTLLALDAYRDQLAHTPVHQRKRLSELQYHIGECLLSLDRTSEAFSAFLRAAELDDHNTKAHLRLGELYLQAGEVERASEHAMAVLKNSGSSADALSLVGAAAAAGGNYEVARDAYSRALALEPGRIKAAIALAEVYQHSGDAEHAREVLRKVAESQPSSAMPWLSMGRLEEQEGHGKDAEQAYRKAVEIENTPDTNLRLAQFLQRVARMTEAEAVLQRVDQQMPYFPVAVADFQVLAGSPEKARSAYLNALSNPLPRTGREAERQGRASIVSRLIETGLIDVDSDHPKVRSEALEKARQYLSQYEQEIDRSTYLMLKAEIALASDDLVQASVAASAALEQAPDSAAAHYLAGVVRYRLSDVAAAHSEWESAIEKQTNFAPARMALARDALKLRNYRAAQEYVVPVIRQEPANVEALTTFAQLLIASRAYDSAKIIIQRIESLAPTSPAASILSGQMAMNIGNYQIALLEYQKAVLIDVHSSEAIDGLTKVYAAGRVTRSMLLNMERIGTSQRQSPTLLEITGRVFANMGMYKDAQRCLKEALEIDPERRSASEWLARVEAHRGNFGEASRSAADVRELSPMLAGVEAEQRRDLEAAVSRYETAVRSGDKTGVAANNLAWIYAQRRTNLDRALELANRARELQPANPAVMDTLGYVYLSRREYSQAVRVLEEARKMAAAQGISDADVLAQVKQHLSEAYLRAGETERAQLIARNSTKQ